MTSPRNSARSRRGILSHDSGATDPILIIAGIAITLILLVGGTFAVAGFMNNARDLNAKGDLDRVATAQTAAMASTDTYQPSAAGPRIMSGKANGSLASGGIGFVPSDDTTVVVAVGQEGWAALAESSSGASFLRTSESSATIKVDAADIREDFLITALEGRLVDSNASAASTDTSQVVKFPSDVSVYNLAWTWVDAVWGLPADSRPEPGASRPGTTPTPGDGGAENPGGGTTNPPVEPGPSVPPMPTEPPLKLDDPFSSTTLDKADINLANLNQTSSTSLCVYVSYSGQGTGWNIILNPDHVLFNNDLDPSHYQVSTKLQVQRVANYLVISPKPAYVNSSSLVKGQMNSSQVCNTKVPLVITSQVDSSAQTVESNGSWEKKVTVSTTSPYMLSWKIRVDFTDVVEKYGMKPSGFNLVRAGNTATSPLTYTHVGGNVYEFVGSGSVMDVKAGKSASFSIIPKVG